MSKKTKKTSQVPAQTETSRSIAEHNADVRPIYPALNSRESSMLALLLVVGITIATFSRVPFFDFVNWDDTIHVYQNPFLIDHTYADIGHFWRHSYEDLYVPLSYTVFAVLNVVAYRSPNLPTLTVTGAPLDPHFFHVTNLFLHTMNCVMVFLLLRRLVKSDLPSVFGALLFAVHPLQVESVAWISELRGLLSGFFCLASIHSYLSAAESRMKTNYGWYSISLLLFICALLSKPSAVVLGLVIALLAVWVNNLSWKRALTDASPFLVGGVIVSLVTSHVQTMPPNVDIPLWLHPFVAGDALTFYLVKLVAPFRLAIDYGRTPKTVVSHWWTYIEWLLPTGVAISVWKLGSHFRLVSLGFTIAFCFLLPVLGIVPFGFQHISTTADRYIYLPMVGVGIALASALDLAPALLSKAIYVAVGILLIASCCLSTIQTNVWQNEFSLGLHTVAINPNSPESQNNLANAYQDKGDYQRAVQHQLVAVNLTPDDPFFLDNLGLYYEKVGKASEAESVYRREVSIAPLRTYGHGNLGRLLLTINNDREGLAELKTALRIEPKNYLAADDLGTYYAKSGKYAAAIEVFESCLLFRPEAEHLWQDFGRTLLLTGQREEAIQALQMAVKLNPRDRDAASLLHSLNADQ